MAESKLFVGNVEVLALTDSVGDFPFPLSQLFPTVPAEAWLHSSAATRSCSVVLIPGTTITAVISCARRDAPSS